MEIEMHLETIDSLITQWRAMTSAVVNLKEISKVEIQDLLKRTYKLLIQFHKSDLIPRELSKMLHAMNEFMYFAELMEKNEGKKDVYHYFYLLFVFNALTQGFFDGEYQYEFPRLNIITSAGYEYIINFDEDIFIFS